MNVLYACNDNYARHLAVSMTSLFDRNQNARSITVYVISMGVSDESQTRLKAIAARYGRKIHFIEFSDIESCGIDTHSYDISIMGRLFAGRLLPESVRKILYLDCDTVIVRSLAKLWRTDLQGNILGAVMEPTIYRAVRQNVGLSEKDAYVNSGVLLIDLKRWRETDAEKRLLRFHAQKNGRLFACDQDMINGALKDEILPILSKYNFFPNYRYFRYDDLVRHMPAYSWLTQQEFREAKRHPVIIHYAGDERPWIAGNLNHYRKAYETYLAMTPWAGTPREEGKRLYMLAYHLMDYMTVLCPPVRWFISEHLAMRIVCARDKTENRARSRKNRTGILSGRS